MQHDHEKHNKSLVGLFSYLSKSSLLSPYIKVGMVSSSRGVERENHSNESVDGDFSFLSYSFTLVFPQALNKLMMSTLSARLMQDKLYYPVSPYHNFSCGGKIKSDMTARSLLLIVSHNYEVHSMRYARMGKERKERTLSLSLIVVIQRIELHRVINNFQTGNFDNQEACLTVVTQNANSSVNETWTFRV